MGMSASQARLLTLTARMSDLEYSAQQVSNSKQRLAIKSEQVSQEYSDALNKKKLEFKTYNSSGDTVYVDLTAKMLMSYDSNSIETQRMLKDSSGRVLVTSAEAEAYKNAGGDPEKFLNKLGYTKTAPTTTTSGSGSTTTTSTYTYDTSATQWYTNVFNAMKSGYMTSEDNLGNSDWLHNQLQNGNLYLYKYNKTKSNEDGTTGGFDSLSWESGDTSIVEETDDHNTSAAEAKYNAEMTKINSKDKQFDLELKNIDTEHSAIQTEVDSVKTVINKNIERSFKVFSA